MLIVGRLAGIVMTAAEESIRVYRHARLADYGKRLLSFAPPETPIADRPA